MNPHTPTDKTEPLQTDSYITSFGHCDAHGVKRVRQNCGIHSQALLGSVPREHKLGFGESPCLTFKLPQKIGNGLQLISHLFEARTFYCGSGGGSFHFPVNGGFK
jgi:hypothetical protein